MQRAPAIGLLLAGILHAANALAYPLDGYGETGITRLEAYRRATEGGIRFLPRGAEFPGSTIRLHLEDRPDFRIPDPDRAFSAKLAALLGSDRPYYGIALLDLTDPWEPRYAEHNATMTLSPASVGKIVVALSLFQALADVYPDDIDARRRVLRETVVTANRFIRSDEHKVPVWTLGDPIVIRRPLEEGDAGNLWTYLDWMCSASSNAAASMVQREALLLRRFGREYPVDAERARAYFDETPKAELQSQLAQALEAPVTRNGLDLSRLRQGRFFTREAKSVIPGTSSHATSRELLRYLVRMEQGRLIDAFSSLAIKRLLYLTDVRIRYASSPALTDAAVYFKSGSLFGCTAEKGFVCEKYRGNVRNYMNSVAIVETPNREPPLRYLVAVMSNVLRKNSGEVHQALATEIHRLIESLHPIGPPSVPGSS